MAELPCDGDGVCMICKQVPPDTDVLLCNGCVSPWHMQCLKPPLGSPPGGDWFCPDCSLPTLHNEERANARPPADPSADDLVGRIRAIQADPNLSEAEKARKRQELMARGSAQKAENDEKDNGKRNTVLEMLDESLNCIFCMQLPDRPVTTPCGHNFCLKCFQRWMGQGKKSCAKCRSSIPPKMASQPRINSALVMAIRMAKAAANAGDSNSGSPKVYQYIQNENKPDKAFTTERAKRKGLSNACSGRIFVTVPPDHFGPILAKNDPERNQGVLVGECWDDRLECRQWGVHLPHVAGISGQSDYGAQSVALSGGYEDDEDHGEWFLYTGSGGRDLSGNKRTNKDQSFDQKFDKYNEALRVSCKMGYPVRVVRSHKEKRSSYAPENGVRYDGVYRIEKCWRKKGIQGFKVCRYLFVRCDNEPAPWTSDEHGDRPRPLPIINELKEASDVTVRKCKPAWDWKDNGEWGWTRDPPPSRKLGSEDRKRGSGQRPNAAKFLTIKQKLLKEFSCSVCKHVLTLPLSTPCGHNFCKPCIEGIFAGQQDVRERGGVGGRALRAQKIVKKCPSCQGDITDFLLRPQVNRQMEDVIRSLKGRVENGSGSDVEEEGNQAEEIEDNEFEAKQSELQQVEDSVKIPLVETPQSKTTGKDNSLGVQEGGTSDKRLQGQAGERLLNLEQEKSIKELCSMFPQYSEDLLRNMLADQEGDMKELKALLRALQRQEKKATRRAKDSSVAMHENNSSAVEGSDSVKDLDVEVSKSTDSRKGNAIATEASALKLPNLFCDKNKSAVERRNSVRDIDVVVSESIDSRKGNAIATEASPLKFQSLLCDKSKEKSSKKRGREVLTPVRVYKTRGRAASENLEVGAAAGLKTPIRDCMKSTSPSSPLVVVSDSDFE